MVLIECLHLSSCMADESVQ
uniref:Uncharacterized protein n=1 Tax=Arundo donax TaxID=35708 RepID=A0A0A9EP18_ARUDO